MSLRLAGWRGCLPLVWMCLAAGGCTLRVGHPGPLEFSVLGVGPADEDDLPRLSEWIREAAPDVILAGASGSLAWLTSMFPVGGGGEPTARRIFTPGFPVEPDAGDRLPPLRPPPPLSPPGLEEWELRAGPTSLYLLTAWIPPTDAAGTEHAAREILLRIAQRSAVDALVVVAVGLGDPAIGGGLDLLVGGYLQGRSTCPVAAGGEGHPGTEWASEAIRVYYAPVARLRCVDLRTLEGGSGILLRLRTRP